MDDAAEKGRGDRRERLLDAMEAVLAERGYAGATVKRVAARAGLAPGLVHYYFGRKLDLQLAVVQRVRRVLAQRLTERPDSLDGVIDACLALPGDPATVRCAVVLSAESLREPEVRAAWSQVLRWLRARFEAHVVPADASALVAAVVGSWQLGSLGVPPPRGSAADAVKRLAATL